MMMMIMMMMMGCWVLLCLGLGLWGGWWRMRLTFLALLCWEVMEMMGEVCCFGVFGLHLFRA